MIAFKERKAGVPSAIKAMLTEARKIANDEAEFDTLDDVFGDERKCFYGNDI